MTPESIQLTKRYVDSYTEYFNDISDNRLLVMSVNPLLVTHGFDEIIALLGDKEGNKIKERTKEILRRGVHELAKGMSELELRNNSNDGCEGKWL